MYKTSMPLILGDGLNEPINPQVLMDGNTISKAEFITDLITNHNAIELIEPIDYSNIIIKHNHDRHAHAGGNVNDILN